MQNVVPQWQGIAGNSAGVEGVRMVNIVQRACGAGMAGRTIPQWQQNAENGAVVAKGDLRKVGKVRLEVEHGCMGFWRRYCVYAPSEGVRKMRECVSPSEGEKGPL